MFTNLRTFLLCITGLLVLISSFTLAMGGISAARTLHTALLENKFRTPQSFFDTTPTGRIINRFSKDIYVIDEVIPPTILMFLGTFFTSVSTMIVIISSTPLFAVVIIPLAIVYFFVQVNMCGCQPDVHYGTIPTIKFRALNNFINFQVLGTYYLCTDISGNSLPGQW